jgi:hypothetical protein
MTYTPQLAVANVRRAGWPKTLQCLRCGRLRVSTGPGDRLHAHCRVVVAAGDSGPECAVRIAALRRDDP